jgi:hypothetical protein
MGKGFLPLRHKSIRGQGRRNSKYEARNSKQYQKPNAQMTKTKRNRGLRGLTDILTTKKRRHEKEKPLRATEGHRERRGKRRKGTKNDGRERIKGPFNQSAFSRGVKLFSGNS